MAQIGVGRAALLGAGIVGLLMAGTARAQMPPEAAEITYCLCTQREVSQLSAEMRAKMGALHRANQRVSDLNAQLRQDREGLDVNNPAAVEHYKLLLEEHDRAWKASVGPVWTAARDAVARYNAVVRQYNGRCGHRLFDTVMMRQVQATLTCSQMGVPPPASAMPPGEEYPPPAGYPPPPGPPAPEYPPPPPPYR